jgi:hypothetical protein
VIESEYRQRYAVRAETYWRELCLNLEYQERMFREALGCLSMKVVEHEGSYETGVRRRLQFQKRVDAPLAIRKLVGDSVTIEEVSTFDAREKRWTYQMIPAVIGDRVEIFGAVRLDENAEGVEQLSQNRVTCKIFGIGGIVEHFVAKSTVEGNADKAAFTHRYIAEKGLR